MERFSDKQVMTDEEALAYLEDALETPNYFENGNPIKMVQNGKVLINGRAFKKMLLFGAPTYYIAWADDKVIYDFAYAPEELLDSCRSVMRLVGEREPKKIGFSLINGKQLYENSIQKWKPEMVKETINYPFGYRD
jgi:hypothetical protein